MLEYQQQIGSLEGECRELKTCLQVGEGPITDDDEDVTVSMWLSSVWSLHHI